MFGYEAGELVVAAVSEAVAAAGDVVVAVGVEGVEAVAGGDGLGGRDLATCWGAVEGACGRLDGGGRDAEAVADVEGEGGVRDESIGGDGVAEEDGGGATEAAGSEAGDGVGGCVVEEALVEAVAGDGVGEDGLGVAVGDEANVGDGGGVGGRVEEEGVDAVEEVGVVCRRGGEGGGGGDGGEGGVEDGEGGDGGGVPGAWVSEVGGEEGVSGEGGKGVDDGGDEGGGGEGGGVGEGDAAGGGREEELEGGEVIGGVARVLSGSRRTAARAVMACVLAAEESEGASGVAGEGWVVMVGGVRRKWWLKVVWGRRQRMRMRVAPWAWTPGMEVKWWRRLW